MSSWPWWIILIIIFVVLILYFIIPWNKIYKKKKEKDSLINEPKEYIDSEIDKKVNKVLTPKEIPENKPMLGIYNWFGKKEALRLKTLVYVQPEEDCCDLCLPFEREVLSLEKYDNKYITMSEAISKGYHHIGCKHIDLDFFPGTTFIAEKPFSEEFQKEYHQKILKLYKLENEIRNLKYEFDNIKKSKNIESKIEKKEVEIQIYCDKNNLERNIERENPYIQDINKFR